MLRKHAAFGERSFPFRRRYSLSASTILSLNVDFGRQTLQLAPAIEVDPSEDAFEVALASFTRLGT